MGLVSSAGIGYMYKRTASNAWSTRRGRSSTEGQSVMRCRGTRAYVCRVAVRAGNKNTNQGRGPAGRRPTEPMMSIAAKEITRALFQPLPLSRGPKRRRCSEERFEQDQQRRHNTGDKALSSGRGGA